MNSAEVSALISLLDDPDEEVYKHIREKLLSIGIQVIPVLEDAWEHSFDTLIQSRIESIIHNIQFGRIQADLTEWLKPGNQKLLEGALLIARYQYPDIDEVKVRKHIDQIRQDIWLEINSNLTALEKVKVLNHIIFEVHGFSGNTTNYHAPQNSYLNNVLETKKGNPLSLSILYSIIAEDVGIPIYGVNLPEHFILAYIDDTTLTEDGGLEDAKVLFYINPFSKGSIFNRREIDSFLKQLKLDPQPSFYEPCTNADILRRLLRNLIISYEKLGYPNKIEELKQLLSALAD
jgi:regulator of sirC expression with transglutaminase-like and TPR domain